MGAVPSLASATTALTVYCGVSNSLPGGELSTQGLVAYGPGEDVKGGAYSFVASRVGRPANGTPAMR
jgi:hypothetical protein